MRNKSWLLCLILLLSGCSSFNVETDGPKVLVPVNLLAGYFGTVAVHEGGHAGAAAGLGGKNIEVDVLPTRDRDGEFHLGLTTTEIDSSWSDLDETIFLTMGPTASFLAHVSTRELLKSGQLPNAVQPTVAWFSLCNSVSYYFHVGAGLLRIDSTDLGKQDVWISIAMLMGAMTYDLYDLFSDNGNYIKVLFGEGFYKPDDRPWHIVAYPQIEGGGFLGLRLRF